ncbi:hypothetical protein HDV04_001558 [Boothiomyces sp. JEL0838]|nr:hypothetical protein HDV04_001558 [Boothiomyces sp. JEL0838]
MTIENTPVKLSFGETKRRTPGPAGAIAHPTVVKKQRTADSGFEKSGGWDQMLRTIKDYQVEATKRSKIQRLIVLIKELQKTEDDFGAIFCDPTGVIKGTIHRQVQESFGDSIKVGTVFELIKVTLFQPTFTSQYLNVTLGNLKRLFPADGDIPIEVPTQQWTHYHHDLTIDDRMIGESKYFVNPQPKKVVRKPNYNNYRKKTNRPTKSDSTRVGSNLETINSSANTARQQTPQSKRANTYSKSLISHKTPDYTSRPSISLKENSTENLTANDCSLSNEQVLQVATADRNASKKPEEDEYLFNEIPDEWLTEM